MREDAKARMNVRVRRREILNIFDDDVGDRSRSADDVDARSATPCAERDGGVVRAAVLFESDVVLAAVSAARSKKHARQSIVDEGVA